MFERFIKQAREEWNDYKIDRLDQYRFELEHEVKALEYWYGKTNSEPLQNKLDYKQSQLDNVTRKLSVLKERVGKG